MVFLKRGIPCELSKFMEQSKEFINWLNLAKKRCEMELIAWLDDCMLWFSIWKARLLLRSQVFLKYIIPKFVCGCADGRTTTFREYWKDIGQAVQIGFLNGRKGPLQIFWTAGRLPMDLTPASGHVRWYPELLKKNFLSLTILRMFLASSMNSNSLSSGLKRYLPEQTRLFSRVGFAADTLSLKKSQKRKSGYPLRGRSQLSARPNPLSNMGKGRLSAGNPYSGATQYPQNLRDYRIVLRPLPLSFPGSLQCSNIHSVSGENITLLLPPEDLSYSRQRFLSQRSQRLELVPESSFTYGSLQSSSVFAETQCHRTDLAPYTDRGNTQQIFSNSTRTSNNFDFYFSQYPTKSTTSSRISASLSIKRYSFIYASLYIKGFGRRLKPHAINQ